LLELEPWATHRFRIKSNWSLAKADENGEKVQLKEGAQVEVRVEAGPEDTSA